MRQALALLVSAVVAARAVAAPNAQFQLHPVRAIPQGDRIVVEYAGLPVTVRLVHLAFPKAPEAKAHARVGIESLIKGKRVRVAYCPEAGLDADGLPQVYVIAGIRNVNVELVRRGLARYDPASRPSKYYHTKMAGADAAARKAGAGVWGTPGGADLARGRTPSPRRLSAAAGAREPAGVVYSELNSSMYHLPNCPWAHRMSPQRRIRYRSREAAERVDKKPCWSCMGERAKRQAFGPGAAPRKVRVIAGRGPIVGSGGVFHAPNCERVLEKPIGGLVSLKTVAEAKGRGSKPCDRCLRLGGGPIPLPSRGECIGRAPPHRRPCRRAPVGKSGLCQYCLGKGE